MRNVESTMTPTGSNQAFCTLASIAESLSDGMVDQQEEQQQPESINVTLVFSKVTRQVLCVEAGKDFVDLLLSFLALPMGCIVKLLSDASLLRPQDSAERIGLSSMVQSVSSSSTSSKGASKDLSRGCGVAPALCGISNVYDSVVKMDDSLLRIEKSLLLDARPQIPACAKLLPFPPLDDERKEVNYYCCGVSCHFVSRKFGAKCPRHKRKMDTLCKMVDSDVQRHDQAESKFGGGYFKAGMHSRVAAGYMKAGTHFVITNNLDIYPSSAIKSLSNLKMLQSERISDLDHMDVPVGPEEVLQLLKASVCSGNVLNKIFGKHIRRSVGSHLPACKCSTDMISAITMKQILPTSLTTKHAAIPGAPHRA